MKKLLILPFLLSLLFGQSDSLCFECYPIDSTASRVQMEQQLDGLRLKFGTAPMVQVEGDYPMSQDGLIIAGSITCPQYTGVVDSLNVIAETYSVAAVYTLEAHPLRASRSPYGCFKWTLSELQSQPYTMEEREVLRDSMLRKYPHNFPVYMDSKCNGFLNAYGPNPAAWWVICRGQIAASGLWFDHSKIMEALGECALSSIDPVQKIDLEPVHLWGNLWYRVKDGKIEKMFIFER